MAAAINAVIFDMDGLLIDTEPIWRRTEIATFGRLGLHLTEEQCLETMGVRVPDVVRLWYSRHPWTGPTIEDVTDEIVNGVIDHVRNEGVPLPGVMRAFETVRDAGLTSAIASSSSLSLIAAVIERLDLAAFVSVVCSAEDDEAGKPHPAVYLRAASLLGVPPRECLALEDSPNGILSATAAGMMCIAVPDRNLASDPRIQLANLRLDSLEQFTPDLLSELMHPN